MFKATAHVLLVVVLVAATFHILPTSPSMRSEAFVVHQWSDEDGTFTISDTSGAWSVTNSPHGSFSGSAQITDMGEFFSFNGSGSAGVQGYIFPGSGGSVTVQGNSGPPFTISQ